MSREERDALALELLEQMLPMLIAYVDKYRGTLEYDDLYQEAYIVLLRMIENPAPGIKSWYACGQARVKNRIIDILRYHGRRYHDSLDAPIAEYEDMCLADIIASSEQEPLSILMLHESLQDIYARIERMPKGITRRALQWRYDTAMASLDIGTYA